MIVNYCFPAFGATIADFDTVFVKDLVEAVILRETVIKQILKMFLNFCGYISTEREVKPDYISFVVTFVVSFCVYRVVL